MGFTIYVLRVSSFCAVLVAAVVWTWVGCSRCIVPRGGAGVHPWRQWLVGPLCPPGPGCVGVQDACRVAGWVAGPLGGGWALVSCPSGYYPGGLGVLVVLLPGTWAPVPGGFGSFLGVVSWVLGC